MTASRKRADAIAKALADKGVALLPPMDALEALDIVAEAEVSASAVMLDPWYNKGFGDVIPWPEYDEMIHTLLTSSARVAGHVYLWGFPEIMARYAVDVTPPMQLEAWLTWYYKNNPSVIRGWRSAQMTCLHFRQGEAPMYPYHFLNEKQMKLKEAGKLRYMPGPPSVLDDAADHPMDVIESALLVGFIGKKEQTGHKAQKPVKVYEKLLLMVTDDSEVVVDPMAGSGTTGATALLTGRRAILADINDDYVSMMEERLQVERLRI